MANIGYHLDKLRQDPALRVVAIITAVIVPGAISSAVTIWSLASEAQSIRNKIDGVVADHAKLEARVQKLREDHDALRVNLAKCCQYACKPLDPFFGGASGTQWAVYR